jgi:lysyl-tRNA synthetase class 2
MIVRCHEELFEMFPTASIHGIVFEGVAEIDPGVAIPWKSKAIDAVRSSGITAENILASPPVTEWRNAFQKFGVKPSKYRSSIEQLLRRALKNDILQTPLTLVNLYCYVSLIQLVPMGAYDLQNIKGDITVRFADSGEPFLGIGESDPILCDPGVVVYSDDGGLICWAWNHRDAARTSLTQQSNRVIFFADSASRESEGRAESAMALLRDALTPTAATEIDSFVLTCANQTATINS